MKSWVEQQHIAVQSRYIDWYCIHTYAYIIMLYAPSTHTDHTIIMLYASLTHTDQLAKEKEDITKTETVVFQLSEAKKEVLMLRTQRETMVAEHTATLAKQKQEGNMLLMLLNLQYYIHTLQTFCYWRLLCNEYYGSWAYYVIIMLLFFWS